MWLGAPYPNAVRLLPTQASVAESHLHVDALRAAILRRLDARLSELGSPEALLREYHQRLLGWGQAQRWQLDGSKFGGILESIDLDGRLCVQQATDRHRASLWRSGVARDRAGNPDSGCAETGLDLAGDVLEQGLQRLSAPSSS